MASLIQSNDAAALIPLGIEYGIASCLSLLLLVKTKPRANFGIAIAYSSIKLLAICSTLARAMNIFGFIVIPFLLSLLINEVVLLVLSIRLREVILVIPFSKLYSRRIRAVRFVSELTSVINIVEVCIVQPFISCSCDRAEISIGFVYEYCKKNDTDVLIGSILSGQLRGLALAISVTASIAAISSMRFMVSSFGREMSGNEDRDVIQWMMMDAGWKQVIRTVYGVLGIFVNGLFAFTFFYSGTNDCLIVGENTFRYGMGGVPSSLLNAIMAISQVFMADMLLRIAGKGEEKGLGYSTMSFQHRAKSQIFEGSEISTYTSQDV